MSSLWFEFLEVKFEDVLNEVLHLLFVLQLVWVDDVLVLQVGDDWTSWAYIP